MENLEIFEKLNSARVMTGYSGRGMMGAEATALVADSKDDVLWELLEIIESEAYKQGKQSYNFHDAIDGMREVLQASVDNMGKDEVVIY